MPDPENVEQYNHRLRDSIRTEGKGVESVLHQPCPFCAAPDFFVAPIAYATATWLRGSVCAECGRGAKGVFSQRPGGVAFEIVQTQGTDQPEWLKPRMRREHEVVGRG